MPSADSNPCPRCGHPNHQRTPTCPNCETMLPVRHKAIRDICLLIAIPFTIFGVIALIMAGVDAISGAIRHDIKTLDLATFFGEVLVPCAIAGIAWENYFHHKR